MRVGVRDHRELAVWQLANEVKARVFETTRRERWQQDAWLRDQLRRAASSACINVAEGFSRFRPKDFARFLTISKSSLTEVIEHLDDAVCLKLIEPEDAATIQSRARRARGAAVKLITYLQSAKPPV